MTKKLTKALRKSLKGNLQLCNVLCKVIEQNHENGDDMVAEYYRKMLIEVVDVTEAIDNELQKLSEES